MPRNSVQTRLPDQWSVRLILADAPEGETPTINERLHAQVTVFYSDGQSGREQAESVLLKLDANGPVIDGAVNVTEVDRPEGGGPAPSRFSAGQVTSLLARIGQLYDVASESLNLD